MHHIKNHIEEILLVFHFTGEKLQLTFLKQLSHTTQIIDS